MMKNLRFITVFAFVCFFFATMRLSSTGVNYYLQIANPNVLSNWNTMPNGSGTAPSNFTSSDIWNITSITNNVTLSGTWNLDGGATIIIGDGTTSNTFVIGTGGSIPSLPAITVNNNAVFELQTNYDYSNCDPSAGTMKLSTNAADIPVAMAFGNLIINDDISLLGTGVVVSGTLTISSGKTLTFSNGTCLLTVGAVAGTGEMDGLTTSNSKMLINGSGGTITFKSGGRRLSDLVVSLTNSTDVLTLGSDLTIDQSTPVFTLTKGILSIGSKVFTNNGQTSFNSNGTISGTSTSTLIFGGSTSISGSMFMTSSSNSLSILTFNKSGINLTLGNTLNLMDFVNVTAGTIASGGNLNLVASTGKKGSVGPMGASGFITGNVIANCIFPAGNTDWALLGVNGITGKSLNDLQSQIAITCTNCNYTPGAVGGFTSVQGWDQTTGTYVTDLGTSSPFTPGLGYWVYTGNTSPNTVGPAMTWSYSGTVAQQGINVSTTINGAGATPNFNLVANPYPCPISWTSLYNNATNSAKFNNVVYFYVRGGGAGTYDTGGGTTGSYAGGDDIPAGQGFFVERLAGVGAQNLAFAESVKSTGNSANLSRPVSSVTNSFRLRVNGIYDTDDAMFRIDPIADIYYGKGDARKFFTFPKSFGGQTSPSKRTSVSSKDPNGADIAVNSFPPMSNNLTIPVLVKVSVSGSYTLHASEFDNYQSCIVIKDKLTNAITDLKIKDYVFNINDTTATPRFELFVCSNGAAPVSIPEFFASSNLSINQDAEGVVVRSNYTDNTKSLVSVYNLLGQKILDEVELVGVSSTHLNISDKNQVVLIKVVNNKESLTRKVMVN